MSNKELKPCPFCGGEAKIYEASEEDFRVGCIRCHTWSDYYFTEDEAIKAWNRRNYPEKQDSSIGEKIIDAIIENKLFSVINPRTNKEIKETLIVWSSMTNEILEAVIAKEFFKSRKNRRIENG